MGWRREIWGNSYWLLNRLGSEVGEDQIRASSPTGRPDGRRGCCNGSRSDALCRALPGSLARHDLARQDSPTTSPAKRD